MWIIANADYKGRISIQGPFKNYNEALMTLAFRYLPEPTYAEIKNPEDSDDPEMIENEPTVEELQQAVDQALGLYEIIEITDRLVEVDPKTSTAIGKIGWNPRTD